MKIMGSRGLPKEPATIIAQINGKIIHMNIEAQRALTTVHMGNSISRIIDCDYINKMSLFNRRIDVVVPKNCNFEKAVVRILGTGVTKTVEIRLFNSDTYEESEQLDDKRIFASFSDVIGKEVFGTVKLTDFASKLVECLKNDLRFAYRKFEVECGNDCDELYANFAHLSVLAVATVIVLNEVDYRSPIKIRVNKILNSYILDMSVKSNTFIDKEGVYAMCQTYPNIAMRLMYIASLCESDDISYEMKIKPNGVNIRYVINEMVNDTGRFSAPTFATSIMDIFAYALDIFAGEPKPIDTSEAEQE